MFLRAMWGVVVRYPLVERLSPKLAIWELGGVAMDAIGRRAGQCTLSGWVFDLFPSELYPIYWNPRFPEPSPCLTCPPFELIERYIIGGITREFLELGYKLQSDADNKRDEMDERIVLEAFVGGANLGTKAVLDELQSSIKRTQRLSRTLGTLLPKLPEVDRFLE